MIIPHTQQNKFLLPRLMKLFLQGKWDVHTKSSIEILKPLSSLDQIGVQFSITKILDVSSTTQ